MKDFNGFCPNCKYYFPDLYDHTAKSDQCFKFLLEHKARIDSTIDRVKELKDGAE
jgi:hypothetical protein